MLEFMLEIYCVFSKRNKQEVKKGVIVYYIV